MPNADSYTRSGYLALKKETTAGTAVQPDVYAEIISEEIVVNYDITPSATIAGNRSMNNRPVLNRIEPIEGTIEILLTPKVAGHFLTGLLGEAVDSTLQASTVYQHDFSPLDSLPTYTFDVKPAGKNYVNRYFGCVISGWELSIDENKILLSISFMGQRAFTNARITTAASSGTALALDQTSGLTTNDTLQVLDADDPSTVIEELTVSTITDENTLVVSTISQSLAVDDIVVIKKGTPTYDLGKEFIWSGGAQAAIGNGAHAMQNLSAWTNLEELTLTATNETEARYAPAGKNIITRFPSVILGKGFSLEGELNKYYQNPEFTDMLRENEQLGVRIEFLGEVIASNSAAAAGATIETDGSDTLSVTIDAAGEAGNDYAIIFTTGNGSLTASLSGKLITVNLDATGSNNTTTLVAAAIDGLTGISCSDTGTDLVTTTDNASKIYFSAGRDANEVEKLRIDLPDVRLKPFNANNGNDDIIQEDIPFVAFRDENDNREVFMRLRNTVSDY